VNCITPGIITAASFGIAVPRWQMEASTTDWAHATS
jgi:hypothetical protein